MKLKPVQIKDLVMEKGIGQSIEGTIIFSNFTKENMEKMSMNAFQSSPKSNFQSELDIGRVGNEDDEEPSFEICKKIHLSDVKLDKIPLDDVDLDNFKPESKNWQRGYGRETYDNFYNQLKKIIKPIELERDSDSEGFLGEFFNGSMKIIPSKSKFEEGHPKFENITFDLDIDGCSLIFTAEDGDINDIKTLFRNTVVSEVNLERYSHKDTKATYKLDRQLTHILTGKTKKIPTALFNKFKDKEFRGTSNPKTLFIASLKDNAVYQIESDH